MDDQLREEGRLEAFPAIRWGVYRYPIRESSEVAVAILGGELRARPVVETVIFAAFGDEIERELRAAFARIKD